MANRQVVVRTGTDWRAVAMIGAVGLGLWYLIGKTAEGVVETPVKAITSGLSSVFDWGTKTTVDDTWAWLFGNGDGDHKDYDRDGCMVGVTSWCDSLQHCVPFGLTCPELKSEPYIPPSQQWNCGTDFYLGVDAQGNTACVRIPGTEPVEEIPYTPGLVDVCQWPNGDPLTVPPGMDCAEAVQSMCKRFSIIPGYKGC